jgi:transcriptional regulator with XRE-family HTH domain
MGAGFRESSRGANDAWGALDDVRPPRSGGEDSGDQVGDERPPEINVGRRIREAREVLDLNQEELAERIGVSQRAVSYVEKQVWVKQSTLQKYARSLGRSLAYFLRPYHAETGDAGLSREEAIQQAYSVVCRDHDFGFGSRPHEQLSPETKQDIIRLYERYKGVSLLPTKIE